VFEGGATCCGKQGTEGSEDSNLEVVQNDEINPARAGTIIEKNPVPSRNTTTVNNGIEMVEMERNPMKKLQSTGQLLDAAIVGDDVQRNPLQRREDSITVQFQGALDALEDRRTDSAVSVEAEEEEDDFTALFHRDANDDKLFHGPFTLEDYREWMNDGHFSGDHIVKSVSRMESIPLSELLRDDSAEESECSEFFHRDADNDKVLYGPFSVEDYREWVSDEHFTGDDMVVKISLGRMKSFPLSDVLRANDGGAFHTMKEFFDHHEEDGRARWEKAKTQ
jgi:hypothetical protein